MSRSRSECEAPRKNLHVLACVIANKSIRPHLDAGRPLGLPDSQFDIRAYVSMSYYSLRDTFVTTDVGLEAKHADEHCGDHKSDFSMCIRHCSCIRSPDKEMGRKKQKPARSTAVLFGRVVGDRDSFWRVGTCVASVSEGSIATSTVHGRPEFIWQSKPKRKLLWQWFHQRSDHDCTLPSP